MRPRPLLLHPDYNNNQVEKYPSMADHLLNISWLIYDKKIFTVAFPPSLCRKYTKLFSKFALPLIFLKYYKNIQFSNNKTLKSRNLLNYFSPSFTFKSWHLDKTRHLSFNTQTFSLSYTFIIIIIIFLIIIFLTPFCPSCHPMSL